ncbi:hypothetical protein [Mucilaginibacter sp.]|uniref:hypothetical protein n=1 Tax=Mucilaginibacter sp. TaxID=1882438 RepID=UPI0025ECFD21|nr:hypothetical protein [Mucilaginibacter sp.]
MKKFIAIIFTALCASAFAQTNPITAINITLPANPDRNVANWGTGTSLLMITASAKSANGRIDPAIEESRLLVIIKQNGKTVCGAYTKSTAPQAGFSTLTKAWSGGNAASYLGKDCALAPGDYELSVQFFGNGAAGPIPLSDERIKPFTIKGNDQQAYQPPQPSSPANGTSLQETDIKKPITFRWTPVIPKPQEPVTYRLKVWQLMQGQTGPQAIKSNQPIFTKDVDNITLAIITNITDGPCKPPLMCAFVWNVQALNREGKPVVSNNGTSEISGFKFDISSKADVVRGNIFGDGNALANSLPKGRLPANGATIKSNEFPKFTWEGGNSLYKLKIVEIIGNQSPDNAFRTNKPFFEKDSLNELTFQYPHSAPGFIAGERYAWYVQALNRDGKPVGGNNSIGESLVFKVAGGKTEHPIGNPNLHQNPGYLTKADNKGEPGSPVAPGKQKNEDANTVMGAVSTTRMVVATGQATQGMAITGIDITLPNNPNANTINSADSFGGGASNQGIANNIVIGTICRLVNGRVDPRIEESRILVLIKRDGKKLCGAYTSGTAPVAGLTRTKTIGQLSTRPSTGIANFLGQACVLEPGNYELSVQFFDNNYRKITPLSDEMTKSFTIK